MCIYIYIYIYILFLNNYSYFLMDPYLALHSLSGWTPSPGFLFHIDFYRILAFQPEHCGKPSFKNVGHHQRNVAPPMVETVNTLC